MHNLYPFSLIGRYMPKLVSILARCQKLCIDKHVRGIHYPTPGYFLGKILSRKFPSIPIFDNNNILFN